MKFNEASSSPDKHLPKSSSICGKWITLFRLIKKKLSGGLSISFSMNYQAEETGSSGDNMAK